MPDDPEQQTDEGLRKLKRRLSYALFLLLARYRRGDLTAQEAQARGRTLLLKAHRAAATLGYLRARALGSQELQQLLAAPVGERVALAQVSFLRGFLSDVKAATEGATDAGRAVARAATGAGRKARAVLYGQRLTGTANEAWATALRTQAAQEGTAGTAATGGLGSGPTGDLVAAELQPGTTPLEARLGGSPLQGLPGEVMGLWVLGNAEHCQDCIEEASQGWRPLSEFTRWPGDGSSACLTACKCVVVTNTGAKGFTNAEEG
ncbi:MAG TPA: hypothetical protein VGN26_03960 [Armatimonadota bacterium]|jgi:hypothetical protein